MTCSVVTRTTAPATEHKNAAVRNNPNRHAADVYDVFGCDTHNAT